MARGMVVNEAIVSQANSEAYRDNYARIFGDKPAQKGSWVQDPETGELVSADDYAPAEANGARIMVDRFMEGDVAPDGTDIGSRQKRKAWMQATGCADYGDFKGAREKRRKALAERAEALRTGKFKPDKDLRNLIGRELYKQKVIL